MHKAYKSFAKYYDLIFSSKNYFNEIDFIKTRIKKYKIDAKKILDVGCGTGSHLNLLINDFEYLYGIDINEEILNIARKKSKKINYSTGNMSDFNLSQKFDVILCMYSVFNYNLTKEKAYETLINFHQHLSKKGIVIIALYNPQNAESEMSIHAGKNNNIEVAKINQHYVDKSTKTEFSDFVLLIKDKGKFDFTVEKNHKYKIYSISEMTKMLLKTGFTNIKAFDQFSEKKATPTSGYPVFVAQKI